LSLATFSCCFGAVSRESEILAPVLPHLLLHVTLVCLTFFRTDEGTSWNSAALAQTSLALLDVFVRQDLDATILKFWDPVAHHRLELFLLLFGLIVLLGVEFLDEALVLVHCEHGVHFALQTLVGVLDMGPAVVLANLCLYYALPGI